MKHATVRSHFWERTDENAISIYSFFIHLSLTSLITLFFWSFLFSLRHSLSLPFQSSLLKISLIFAQDLLPPHLVVNLHSFRRRPPQPLPPTFRSLNRFVGVIFGMGFDVWVLGHWLIGWVGILGRWWCRGCGSGWLSFGPAMFVAVVGRQCLLKILSFFFFFFLFFFVEVFGFGICWRSSDCDCNLWRLICRWWWFAVAVAIAVAVGGLWRLIAIVV